jgi:hypothetical protein
MSTRREPAKLALQRFTGEDFIMLGLRVPRSNSIRSLLDVVKHQVANFLVDVLTLTFGRRVHEPRHINQSVIVQIRPFNSQMNGLMSDIHAAAYQLVGHAYHLLGNLIFWYLSPFFTLWPLNPVTRTSMRIFASFEIPQTYLVPAVSSTTASLAAYKPSQLQHARQRVHGIHKCCR